MGKRNKERRAAKARKAGRKSRARRAGAQSPGGGGDWSDYSESDRVAATIAAALAARSSEDPARQAVARDKLASCGPAAVARALERELVRPLPTLWDHGWLPGELVRQIRRATSASGERVGRFAIAADHACRNHSTLHPQWLHHVEDLELPRLVSTGAWLRSRALTDSLPAARDWPELIDLALDVVFAMSRVGPLTVIIPPPGSTRASEQIIDLASREASPALAKVRGLLAQAESTTFDAEAEAFTAKAQELMARHALDEALVWARNDKAETPRTTRLPLDDPYMDAKSLLLTIVAEETQCRAITDPYHGLASIVGFETDLLWCETLLTSLLVQSQHELSRAGAADQAGGRRRSRSFRSSFLVSYACRIGERLAEVNAHVHEASGETSAAGQAISDGSPGGALVPVLAERRSIIDEAVDDQFGELSSGSIRGGSDRLGWSAGRQAADRAELSEGRLEGGAATT